MILARFAVGIAHQQAALGKALLSASQDVGDAATGANHGLKVFAGQATTFHDVFNQRNRVRVCLWRFEFAHAYEEVRCEWSSR
jgi:hypothetical protein